jgi:hypothetical protein
VFYEAKEPINVFNESFAESFVAATTPFFRPDTDYSDYSTGSVLEPTNVNMPIDKVCRHLTLDPGEDKAIISKVEEPIVQEDTLADDADSPMDILPNCEAIDCVLSAQVINPTPAAVEISPAVQGLTLDGHLFTKMIFPTPAAVEFSLSEQGMTFSELLSSQYVKSMVNTMDWNTNDSTSGKSSAICEFSSYSSGSNTCSIHCNAQVDAYSGAMVVCQPNDGFVINKDLDVVEIVDKSCSVNVVCSDGQSLCPSGKTGAHVQTWFDPVIVIARINALIDQGSTSRTVCRHEAFDHRIFDKGKILCSASQSHGQVTDVKKDCLIHTVYTSLTEWSTSTMMLELVNDGKYWIDALHDKMISLLKHILTLRGEYAQYLPPAKEDIVASKSITEHSELGDESACSMIGWFPKHLIMEIVQQMTHYVIFTGSSIAKKCPMITFPVTTVFRRIGLFTSMCAKQLVFTTKNLCERGAMSKKLLNRTSSLASSWLLTMGYVCMLMNHTLNVPIHMSPLTTTTCPNPHFCPKLVFTWWEAVYKKVDNLNFPHTSEKLGHYVDIAPNIDPTMTDTMDIVRHFDDFTPICTADGEPCHRRPAPTDGESIRKHVKFRNSFVLHVAKDRSSPSTLPTVFSSLLPSRVVQHMSSMLCRDHESRKLGDFVRFIIDRGKMNGETAKADPTLSDYETKALKWIKLKLDSDYGSNFVAHTHLVYDMKHSQCCRRVECIIECFLMMHHAQMVDLDFSPTRHDCMPTIYEHNGDEIPSEPPPLLTCIVMVNHVKGLKTFDNSQSDPGSSRDFSCCARIDIDWTSCPMKPCQVKHQANVGDHNSQSDPGSSRDLSCCDRIDIEWPRALIQTRQVIFHKSHAMCWISIVCELTTIKMTLFIHFDGVIGLDHIPGDYWGDHKVWVNIQSKIFHPGDVDTVSTIFKRAPKRGGYFVVEDEVFVKKDKINIGDKFVFELNKAKISDEVCVDSNGRGVSDFPKVLVLGLASLAHDSNSRADSSFSPADHLASDGASAPPDGRFPILSTSKLKKRVWFSHAGQMLACVTETRPDGRVSSACGTEAHPDGRVSSAGLTSAPAKARPKWLTRKGHSSHEPAKCWGWAIVGNQPDGGAIVDSQPTARDEQFNPTSKGKERLSQHNSWKIQVCDVTDGIFRGPEDIHGNPGASGFQKRSERIRTVVVEIKAEHELTIL